MVNVSGLAVTLETVTPLFLAGAEPRAAPELRPPAFRGALRYWLRAALGGVLGAELAAVREAEAAVFGSADERAGAAAVTLRIRHGALPPAGTYHRDPAMSVTKGGRQLRQPTGRDYLYWSMAESGSVERGNRLPAKQYFPPGTAFDLGLNPRPGARDSATTMRQATAALWLLVQLGGIGSRSRRTAGSLSVPENVEAEGLRFALAGSEPASVADQLSAGLMRVRELFAADSPVHVAAPSAFDVLHPAACRVWVLGGWPSSEGAVEAVGAALRDFRTYREPDHREVARWLNGGTIPTVERSAFGLPIPYRYTNGPAGTVQARLGNQVIDRRASPLWLTVSKTMTGAGLGIATLFMSRFLPANATLHARQGGPPAPLLSPPRDYALIEQWVRESFPAAREVGYG